MGHGGRQTGLTQWRSGSDSKLWLTSTRSESDPDLLTVTIHDSRFTIHLL